MRIFSVMVFVFFAAGCASKQYFPYAYEAAKMPKPARTVLLHPTVVRDGMPTPPAERLAAVDAALAARFAGAGYTVDTSSASLARLAAISAELPKPGARPVASSLAPLGEAGVCDLVVFPTLEYRVCDGKNSDCRWDGVVKEVKSDGSFHLISAKLPAASLAARAYACAGEEVFHSMGGLAVLLGATTETTMGQDSASATAGTGRSTVTFRTNASYLDDPATVTEAVALALHPLIAMEGYPRSPKFYDPTANPTRRAPKKKKKKNEIFKGKSTR